MENMDKILQGILSKAIQHMHTPFVFDLFCDKRVIPIIKMCVVNEPQYFLAIKNVLKLVLTIF